MINVVDRDSNGVLDFGEFASLMVKYHGEEQEENELWMAFKVFDRDGTGLISATELKYALTNLGNAMTEDEVNYMFEHGKALLDSDGRLNYSNFLKHFLRRRQGATLLNLTKDPTDMAAAFPQENETLKNQNEPCNSKRTGSSKKSSRKASKKSSVDVGTSKVTMDVPSVDDKCVNTTLKASNAVSLKSSSPAPKSPNETSKVNLSRTPSLKGFSSRLSFKRKSSKSSKTANGPTSTSHS